MRVAAIRCAATSCAGASSEERIREARRCRVARSIGERLAAIAVETTGWLKESGSSARRRPDSIRPSAIVAACSESSRARAAKWRSSAPAPKMASAFSRAGPAGSSPAACVSAHSQTPAGASTRTPEAVRPADPLQATSSAAISSISSGFPAEASWMARHALSGAPGSQVSRTLRAVPSALSGSSFTRRVAGWQASSPTSG